MLNANNPFLSWLIEMVKRLGQKSPQFFVVLQWIFGIITAITGLPAVISLITTTLGYTLPDVFTQFENKTVALCGLVVTFVSALPVQNTSVAKDQTGQVLKQTDTKKLPFTAKAEAKEAQSVNHPIVALKK